MCDLEDVDMPAASKLARLDAKLFARMLELCRSYCPSIRCFDNNDGWLWFFDTETHNVYDGICQCLFTVFNTFETLRTYFLNDDVSHCPLFESVSVIIDKANRLLSPNLWRRAWERDDAHNDMREEFDALMSSYFSTCANFDNVTYEKVARSLNAYVNDTVDRETRDRVFRDFLTCTHFIPLALHAHANDGGNENASVVQSGKPVAVAAALYRAKVFEFRDAWMNDKTYRADDLLNDIDKCVWRVAEAYDICVRDTDEKAVSHWIDAVSSYDKFKFEKRGRLSIAPWNASFTPFLESFERMHAWNVVCDSAEDSVPHLPSAAASCAKHCAWSPKYCDGALIPPRTQSPSPPSPAQVALRETPCSRGARYLMEMSERQNTDESSCPPHPAAAAKSSVEEFGANRHRLQLVELLGKVTGDGELIDKAKHYGVITHRPSDWIRSIRDALDTTPKIVESADIAIKVLSKGFSIIRDPKCWILRSAGEAGMHYYPVFLVGRVDCEKKTRVFRAVCAKSDTQVCQIKTLALVHALEERAREKCMSSPPPAAKHIAPIATARKRVEPPQPTYSPSATKHVRMCAIPACPRRASRSCANGHCPLYNRKDVGVCDAHTAECVLKSTDCFNVTGCHYCFKRSRGDDYHCDNCWKNACVVDDRQRPEEQARQLAAVRARGEATCPNSSCVYSGKCRNARGRMVKSNFRTLEDDIRECSGCGERNSCTVCSRVEWNESAREAVYFCSQECVAQAAPAAAKRQRQS